MCVFDLSSDTMKYPRFLADGAGLITSLSILMLTFSLFSCFSSCCLTPNRTTSLESSISLQQSQILLGTQAFASPPDMASSGVWENVILPKTPTVDGVSGILYFIIFFEFFEFF